MNQTHAPDDAAPHEHPDHEPLTGERPTHERRGPRVTREQVLDVGRLRRSSSDKYVGGVAGGLGRHLDIDPLIVRVVFAVTALFGVGILLYVAFWLLLPDDADHAPIHTDPETRKVLVLVAAAAAAVLLLMVVVGADGSALWLAVLALAGLGVYAVLRRQPTGPYRDPVEPGQPSRPVPPVQPAAMYNPPPRPRRTGVILFWPTLALLAIALGSLAMFDIDHHVAGGAYAAIALALIGLVLVVGAFAGRAGGLILLGLLALPAVVITSTLGNDFTRGGNNISLAPDNAALVQSYYYAGNGRFELNLTSLSPAELAQLDNREIDIDMKAGEVVVTVPEGLGYSVEAQLSVAGEIMADDRNVSGMNPTLSHSTIQIDDAGPAIDLDIEGAAGRILVQTLPVDQGANP